MSSICHFDSRHPSFCSNHYRALSFYLSRDRFSISSLNYSRNCTSWIYYYNFGNWPGCHRYWVWYFPATMPHDASSVFVDCLVRANWALFRRAIYLSVSSSCERSLHKAPPSPHSFRERCPCGYEWIRPCRGSACFSLETGVTCSSIFSPGRCRSTVRPDACSRAVRHSYFL